jgi:GT2 family glycosyltransferase
MNEMLIHQIGVVVIGRNEGERLRACLKSVTEQCSQLVYVDSGSTDNSLDIASELGGEILLLDMGTLFTAARARNAGVEKLLALYPHVQFIQFVDGDCVVVDGWLESAAHYLRQNENFAVVSGRLRERFPDRSVYNMLCDIEWDTPVGEARTCGGIAMMRVNAFNQVGGFKQELIAGEEPELCVRLRKSGWKIWRLEDDMALHDANMTRFSQWWVRSVRNGYAFAEGAYLHGMAPEYHWVRETLSSIIWGFSVPFLVITLLFFSQYWGLLLLAIYPIQVIRLYRRGGRSPGVNWRRAIFLVLGKFPEMIGITRFLLQQFLGSNKRPIEYK